MRKKFVFFVTALLLMGLTMTFGQTFNSGSEQLNSKDAVANYLKGLNSDNNGLRLSSAYFAGEYGIADAVIPLMKMLNNEKSESGRIMAALALTKIASGKSIFAVKQAAKLDKSKRVRELCSKFYNYHVSLQNQPNNNL